MGLVLRTLNGDFDMYQNEDTVQTFSIFNFRDITQRTSDYTNSFKLPLTSNNVRLINYSNEINSIDSLPYSKIECELIVDDLGIRTGFLEINSIDENINVVFYSGNGNFYDAAKSKFLNDLDWSDFDHDWNLTNAVANSDSTTGFFYPVCDYNGQDLSNNLAHIDLILPATYVSEILDRIYTQLGYTYTNNFDTTNLDLACVPYSSKVLTVSAEVLLLNQVDLSNTTTYFPVVNTYNFGSQTGFFTNTLDVPLDYNTIDTGSTNYNFVNRKFIPQYAGNYNYSLTALLTDYNYVDISFTSAISNVGIFIETRLQCIKVSNGVETIIEDTMSNYGYFSDYTGTTYTNINTFANNFETDTISGKVYLSVGDELKLRMVTKHNGSFNYVTAPDILVTSSPEVADTNVLNIDLQPELVFGALITYSSMLPKIKCSDFVRDICIRYGLILSINEYDKTISVNKLESLNTNDSYDWSSKFNDNINDISLSFKFDNYGKISNIKHKEDKTISSTPNGTNYQLIINNDNLEPEKDIYISPFGATENTSFFGYTTSNINLYDTIKSKFNKDIAYRICYSYPITGVFKFIDDIGTESALIDTRGIYFIDESKPELSMGFGLNLINQNSSAIVNALTNLKVLTARFNLNIIDILSINFLKPVYLSQYNSYFFISTINQFNYVNQDLTTVELIKLN